MCDPAPEPQYPVEITITARDAKNREARQDFEFLSDHTDPEKAVEQIHRAVTNTLPGRLKAVNTDA